MDRGVSSGDDESSLSAVPEEALAGGNASDFVLRVVDPAVFGGRPTVRKPWLAQSDLVARYCAHLSERGVDVPQTFGRDEQGRAVTEFVPGTLALDLVPRGLPPLDLAELRRVGALLRSIHDASPDADHPDFQGWPPMLLPPPTSLAGREPGLICHNDATPWNLLVDRERDRFVFIDFDGAGPSTRAWDLAYSAQAFADLGPRQPIDQGQRRLRAFVIEGWLGQPADSQSHDQADEALVRELPALLGQRAAAMHDLLERSHATGVQPWAAMFTDGHGDHWRGVRDHCLANVEAWRKALTLGVD